MTETTVDTISTVGSEGQVTYFPDPSKDITLKKVRRGWLGKLVEKLFSKERFMNPYSPGLRLFIETQKYNNTQLMYLDDYTSSPEMRKLLRPVKDTEEGILSHFELRDNRKPEEYIRLRNEALNKLGKHFSF